MTFPQRLSDGYAAFRSGRFASDRQRYERLAEIGQSPKIMIIACCDSRAAPETIFDAAPGEMFVHRNVANLIPPYETDGHFHGTSAAIEFAVKVLEIRHLVIMGHGRCGGIAAFIGGRPAGPFDFIGRWIELIAPAAEMVADDPTATSARQRAVELASIQRGLTNLRGFPWLAEAENAGRLKLHGAWFDIATGELIVLDSDTNTFSALPAD